eukprot:jgi/Tetstr1/428844/TSEL_018831.t1
MVPLRSQRERIDLYADVLMALKPRVKSPDLPTALESLTMATATSDSNGSARRDGINDVRVQQAAVQLGDDMGHVYEQACYEIRQKHVAVPIPYTIARPVLEYGFEPGVDFMRALGSSTMGKPGGIRMETLKDGEVVLSLDSVASRSPSGPLIAARMGSGIDAENAANAGRLLETSRQPQPHGEALKGRGVQKPTAAPTAEEVPMRLFSGRKGRDDGSQPPSNPDSPAGSLRGGAGSASFQNASPSPQSSPAPATTTARTAARVAQCAQDVKSLREAIHVCTDAAQQQRTGQRSAEDVQAMLVKAAVKAEKCYDWGGQVESMLQDCTEDEATLGQLLQTNDDLQDALKRWQTLLSLDISDRAPAGTGGSSRESYTEEVGLDVLQALGAVDSGSGAAAEARQQAAELQATCEALRQQLAAADANKAAALAGMAAAHSTEINNTKGLAVRKIKELMAQIAELEAQAEALSASRAAAEERSEAAEAALTSAAASSAPASAVDSAELQRLKAEVERMRGQLAAAQTQLEGAQAEVRRLRALVGQLEMQVMEAGQDKAQGVADAEAKLTAKDAELAAMQGKLACMSQSAAAAEDYKARVEAAEKAAASLKLELRKEAILRKKAYNQIREMKGNIRVMCRVRPAIVGNGRAEEAADAAVEVKDEFTLSVDDGRAPQPRKYEFDTCFVPAASQEEVYAETESLLQSAFDGYNVCIFCYGQTGSGKTHTITGTAAAPGIIPRAMEGIFAQAADAAVEMKVSCYMLELYQDSLLDLLAPSASGKLAIKRDANGAVLVDGARVVAVASQEELAAAFKTGLEGRKTAATKMNSESSRSHLVFTILMEHTNLTLGTKSNSKLTFVDLAGSERVGRSGAINDKDRLDEARAINKSLSALGDVVAALTSGESFVPYRNHKLTQLMSDSLGGNAKTLMVVNVSPLASDAAETKSSLDYATRVKQVTNENSRSFETREIQKLKAELAKLRAKK